MVSRLSDREVLADIAVGNKSARRGRPEVQALPEPGEDVAKRLGFRLGRKGQAVSEYLLKQLVVDCDKATLQARDLIGARLRALNEREFNLLNHVRHSLGMFLGLAVVVGALLVDYRIIHEFWTRVAMDDMGRVARAMKLSVYFKSAQVVFATLAFHFMLETLSPAGRKLFIRLIFVLTSVMLVGIGLIVALNWLPANSTLFGMSLKSAAGSGRDVLASLGLAAPGSEAPSYVGSVQTLIWLSSLSMIFIVVTGVGALSLQRAVHEFQILSGAKVEDPDNTDGDLGLRGNRTQRYEQLQARARQYGVGYKTAESGEEVLEYGDAIDERRRAIGRCLASFAGSYDLGLRDYQGAYLGLLAGIREGHVERLLGKLRDSMDQIPEFVAEHLESHHQAFLEASPDQGNVVRLPENKQSGSGRR